MEVVANAEVVANVEQEPNVEVVEQIEEEGDVIGGVVDDLYDELDVVAANVVVVTETILLDNAIIQNVLQKVFYFIKTHQLM